MYSIDKAADITTIHFKGNMKIGEFVAGMQAYDDDPKFHVLAQQCPDGPVYSVLHSSQPKSHVLYVGGNFSKVGKKIRLDDESLGNRRS